MPVTRDRLARPVDISTLLSSARRRVGLVVDEPGLRSRGLGWSPVRSPLRNVLSIYAGGVGTPTGSARRRSGRGRNVNRTPTGLENISPVALRRTRGGVRRNRNSVLPNWYPRTPFRDVSAVVRAIERRRARMRELEDIRPQTRDLQPHEDSPGTSSLAERNTLFRTPAPNTAKGKPQPYRPSKVQEVLADIAADKDSGGLEDMTPQRKVLNSIEKVREALNEDQQRLQQTPAAKRAARQKKVRTLMSMR